MRPTASILHLDLDAFFASVEQRDKPSLRGKPVIVGGIGQRGVVSTASYEARRYGVRSAMSMAEARSRCPHAAFLSGRFDAYRAASAVVMERLRRLSPAVEPLSLDEAFVDLAADPDFDPASVPDLVDRLRGDVAELTGGLTASVGVATSKLMAKIATEIDKPDGSFIVAPGTERDLLEPMPVTVIAGVGPATAARLHHVGISRVGDVWRHSETELVDLLGQAAGTSLHRLSRGIDDRSVSSHRENKSVSTEDTFETDIVDRGELGLICDALARRTAERLRKAGLSGRTVTLKVRYHDFTTHTRSTTLPGPTDQTRLIVATARRLLDATDTGGGLRLLGVGVSGLADWVQDDLFAEESDDEPESATETPRLPADPPRAHEWSPGMDVHHDEYGDGWVWGRGLGLVTVRFETRHTPVGPVRTLRADDPALTPGHRESPSPVAGTVEE
ncbi:DNA polymerase IV [Aeromicrobium duanguangcaii]|uniref:DNA polymerase IV n=1 Tax=Aeromicrobium duanguangcaii TaxID=2968086 RepID=UPI002017F014|nr:DNA polymerase IV [Aeromicrobium duanguangcaii]MCL3837352.1 DNA polymerase IV [Aeromicrobium duanguangcaii]